MDFLELPLIQQTNSADFDAAIHSGSESWFQRLIIEFFVLQSRHSEEHSRFFVQKLKTKWGSCNAGSKSIRLNTELTKKPAKCLEYVIVHDGHLIVRRPLMIASQAYGASFAILEAHSRQTLKYMLPLAHADWA